MNITFWSSPMPNRPKVSGMRAAIGMLRPKMVSGRKKALTRGKQPHRMPSGHADEGGQAEAEHDALQRDDGVHRQVAFGPQAGKAREGLGRARQVVARDEALAVRPARASRTTTRRSTRRGRATAKAIVCQVGISRRRASPLRSRTAMVRPMPGPGGAGPAGGAGILSGMGLSTVFSRRPRGGAYAAATLPAPRAAAKRHAYLSPASAG